MKRFLKVCMLLACALGGPLLANSSSNSNSTLSKDTEKPFVAASSTCNGVYSGSATDKPDVSDARSNLNSIFLDASSFNYVLTVDSISPGKTTSANFTLHPKDYSKPGQALVHARDNANNDTTLSFSYVPRRFTMADTLLDNIYPDSTISYRVPIVNESGDVIQVNSIKLLGTSSEFSLDAATQQKQTAQKHDTIWVVVHFKGGANADYSSQLVLTMGCDSANSQSITLRAHVGTLVFIINDVSFGEKDVNTDWSVDVIAVNNGSLAATLQSLSLKSGTQFFSLKNVASLPLKIAAGASQKVAEVEFKPTAVGTYSDNFSYDIAEDQVGILSTPVVNGSAKKTASGVADDAANLVLIQPNPASTELSIQTRGTADQAMMVQIFDVDGNSIAQVSGQGNDRLLVPLSSVHNGVYLCKIDCGSEQHMIRFMVVH